MKKLYLFGVLLIGVGGALAKPNVTATKAPQVVVQSAASQNLRRALLAIRSMTAEFNQKTSSHNTTKPQVVHGKLFLMRPGQLRWEITAPDVQITLMRQGEVQSYDPLLAQVIKRKLDAKNMQPAEWLAGDLTAVLAQVTVEQQRDLYIITPKNKRAADYQQLRLQFKQGKLVEMQIADLLGQLTVIKLQKVKINQPIAPTAFQFTVPPGTEIITE